MIRHSPAVSRRDVLALGLGAAAAAAMPAFARGATPAATAPDKMLTALLDGFAEEILQLSPTSATSLGIDKGPRVALKARLEDVSLEADAKWAAQVESMLTRLSSVDRAQLGPGAQLRYDAVRHAAGVGAEGTQFSFGGAASGFAGGTAPYPVTQQDGAITRIPEFLDSQHQVDDAADAQAYLARLAAMARMLDQESARIRQQAGNGVMPPSFIANTALAQLRDYRKTAARRQKLVTSIAQRTAQRGIAGNWEARATSIVNDSIYPALERQIAALGKATASATDVAGVHRLPDGEAYYRWALKLGTTTTMSAAEVHAIGIEQNQALQARMDAILRAQGMTQGTVSERMRALSKDPARFFADDDRGRAQLIAYCNERVTGMRALMPQMSHLGLKAPLVIKRVPSDIQAGAALGYMNFASLDGARPAIYYVNLKSTTLWPKHELASLTAHEGIPGHAWQGAYLAEHHADLPLIASQMGFNAFVEGWALYAEQLCDELGLYDSDPFSRLGYLQAQNFRACRLVVDTGIHAMKWSRQRAIAFLVEHTGRNLNSMTSEIDRYTVSPGQACGYKIGHNEMLRQRERAKAELGGKFDLAGFNDAIVSSGGVPLTVLTTVIDQYIGRARAA